MVCKLRSATHHYLSFKTTVGKLHRACLLSSWLQGWVSRDQLSVCLSLEGTKPKRVNFLLDTSFKAVAESSVLLYIVYVLLKPMYTLKIAINCHTWHCFDKNLILAALGVILSKWTKPVIILFYTENFLMPLLFVCLWADKEKFKQIIFNRITQEMFFISL